MATATAIVKYRNAQAGLVSLAERDVRSFWASLDLSNPVRAARLLEQYLPELIQQYGEIGAAVASDFYAELREESPAARKAFSSILGDAIPFDQSAASTRWAVGPLFREEADTAAALSNVLDVTDRLIKQQGRNTVEANARKDPLRVRYARVPSGSETCKFCLMLASRGAVYLDSKAAGEVNKYHGKCDCVPTPVWDDSDYDRLKAESDYDPHRLYEAYLNTAD